MTHEEVLSRIQKEKLIAILRGVPMDRIDGVVGALVRGGVRVLEFTFDHDQPDYLAIRCLWAAVRPSQWRKWKRRMTLAPAS